MGRNDMEIKIIHMMLYIFLCFKSKHAINEINNYYKHSQLRVLYLYRHRPPRLSFIPYSRNKAFFNTKHENNPPFSPGYVTFLNKKSLLNKIVY